MDRLLIATGNQHKITEIEEILAECGIMVKELLSLRDIPGYQSPEEDGDSFRANAELKARSAAQASGVPALADDSGLTVEALQGAPGIYSARYAGEGHDDAANRAKLLAEMKDIPAGQRQAAFVCAVALALPDGEIIHREGRVEGEIAFSEAGEGGFGYDSLFYLPQYGLTMAQITEEQKNKISHRGRAIRAIKDALAGLK